MSMSEAALAPGFELSVQQRLALLDRHRGDHVACAVSALSLGADVNVPRLRAAIDGVVARHEILRTLYRDVPGLPCPVQVPMQHLGYAFSELRGDGPADIARMRHTVRAEVDPYRGPLLGVGLIQLAGGGTHIVFALPTLAADRHSMEQLACEIRSGYEGTQAAVAEAQYVDYAEWQTAMLRDEPDEAANQFWRNAQVGASREVRWAREMPVRSGASRIELWSEPIANALAQLADASGLAPQDTMFSLWAAFLAGTEERNDVVVAVEVDARTDAVWDVLGPFTLQIPVAVTVDGAASVRRTLRSLNLRLEESRSWLHHFQEGPLVSGVRDDVRWPLSFSYVPAGVDPSSLVIEIDSFRSKLHLEYRETGELGLMSPEGWLPAEALAIRAGQFSAFVENAARDIDGRLADVGRSGPKERNRILQDFNPRIEHPPEALGCLHRLLEARAAAAGDATAIVCGERTWTYRQLNERANRLANQLRAWGIGPEQLVAVYAERSAEVVMGVLAVLKAGGAYLPLDPLYPPERIAYMLGDAKPRVILTQERLMPLLPQSDARAWCLEQSSEEINRQPRDNLPDIALPRNLAYCIYTSGSTGRPKACQIEHASLTHYLSWANRYYFHSEPAGEGDAGGSFSLYSSLSFDLTVTSLFLPLLRGKCLHVFGEDKAIDEVLTRSLASGSSIDAIKLTPSHITLLRSLSLPPSGARLAIVGGEALRPDQVRALHDLNPQMQVFNEYGPTEATVGCVVQLIERDAMDVPIGRPIEGCCIYVLGADGELAPLGATGELYIGGLTLARGYRGRPGLTAQRFVPDAYSDIPGARLYRTGDLVRYRPDGALDYLGRADHQVKVHGHRIELGEIEAQLAQLAQVNEAAVLVCDGDAGERLVAYVAPDPPAADRAAQENLKKHLRAELLKALPEYMVPGQFVLLSKLPLNANGKIDRSALRLIETSEQRAQRVVPRNETEAALCAIWMQLLKLDEASVHDNFFELGGDSIVAIQAVSKARRAGLQFTPRELFQHPSIAELALVARKSDSKPADSEICVGDVPLTPIQRWFFELKLTERNHWNQSVLLRFRRPLDGDVIEQALRRLVEHHDALKLRYECVNGEWRQRYGEHANAALCTSVRVTSAHPGPEIEALADQAQRSLDLRHGPLLRAINMTLADGSGRLFLVAHHLVVDGVSWRILIDDLSALYGALESGALPQLPPKTASFQAWSAALERYADDESVSGEMDYWRSVAAALGQASESACGTPRESRSIELDEDYTRRLLSEANLAYRTQIDELLVTALIRALAADSGRNELLLELESHGREELIGNLDLTRTVGWFTALHPVRIASQGGTDITRDILSVKEQLRAVPRHGVGYGVLRYLRKRREIECSRDAIVARFNHLGQFDTSFESAQDWCPASEPTGRNVAEDGDAAPALDWVTMVRRGRLHVSCAFAESVSAERVEELLRRFGQELSAILDRCLADEQGALSPSDVPLAHVTQQQLDRLPLPARDIEEIYGLAPLQDGLLLHTLLNPGSGMYLMQDVFRTDQALDPAAVQRAWSQVVARHAILRTSFLWSEDSAPVQIVHRSAPSPVQFFDWTGVEQTAAEQRLALLLREEIAAGFDVMKPPLSRLRLFKLESRRFVLVHSFHHILMDAWCRPLLFQDFFSCYAAELARAPVSRPEPRRYRDFIAWLAAQDKKAARAYWREQLASFSSVTPVPLARKSTLRSISDVADVFERLSAGETQAFNHFVQEHRLTQNTLMQAAWAIVLGLHADQDDVLFGVTVAGRPTELAGIEHTLGLFINSLPLRVKLPSPSERTTVLAWLHALLAKNVGMRQHEHVPLVEIQALSGLAPGSALFDTLFVFENAPFDAAVAERANALGFEGVSERTHTNYPLTVVAIPSNELTLQISCDLRCVGREDARVLLRQLKAVLLELVGNPHAILNELNWVEPRERQRLLGFEAAGRSAGSLLAGFVERFEQQVRAQGTCIAARCGDDTASYANLNAIANSIAHGLIEHGVQHDDIVLIYAERGLDLLQMIVAAFKAGAGYLALEPGYPPLRLAQVAGIARPRAVLTTQSHQAWLRSVLDEPSGGEPPVVLAKEALCRNGAQSNPGLGSSPAQLAYAIFTSGSTGVPKGVLVEHAGMLNNQWSKVADLELDARDVIAQTASCSFDISVWQLLTGLLCGARIEILPNETTHDPVKLLQEVRQRGITVLEIVPSLIQAMLREDPVDLASLRYLIATGEALPASVARQWLERYPDIPLLNAYGPAECSDDVSMHWQESLPPEEQSYVAIGQATQNNHLYVLGSALQRLPVGAIGEICIAGTGVGRGYLGDPAKTTRSFVPNPHVATGERLYRTGDLGRYGADGAIEYLGRIDHQVKIMGYRVEPGEIESHLLKHAEVAAAAVVVSSRNDASQLVAYVVPVGAFADTEAEAALRERLRSHLLRSLPKYMVPAQFVWLEALPLGENGKIDRRALPSAGAGDVRQGGIPPRTPLEAELAQIWSEVLKVQPIGVRDDFFELGGHSLLVTQVAARVRRRLGVDLSLVAFFEAATIEALAREVERATSRIGNVEDVSLMSSLLSALETP